MSQDRMKVVLKLELYDAKTKQKAMKTVAGFSGVDSVAVDMTDKKLTITGDMDPVNVVAKLNKLCRTEILTIGPAKEPENKEEQMKTENNNNNNNKDKEADDQNKDAPEAADAASVKAYPVLYNQYPTPPPYCQAYNCTCQPHMNPSYCAKLVVEDPNPCVIC